MNKKTYEGPIVEIDELQKKQDVLSESNMEGGDIYNYEDLQ